MTDDRTSATAASAESPTGAGFWPRARRVAWWSIGLGLALEIALLAVAALAQRLPDWAHLAADTVQKGAWSLLVCAGVSCGLAAHRARPAVMGFLGLISGPIAFTAARSLHKGMLHALSAQAAAPGAPVLRPTLMKGAEYALFGVLLGWISQRPRASLTSFLLGGLLIGLAFGGLVIALELPPFPDIWLKIANELFFPVGCAFVLYLTHRLVKDGSA